MTSSANNNELVFTPYEGPLLKLYQQDVHCNICDCKIRLKGVRAHLRTDKHITNTEKTITNTEKTITNTEHIPSFLSVCNNIIHYRRKFSNRT